MALPRTASPATGAAGVGEGHESVPWPPAPPNSHTHTGSRPYLALPAGCPLTAWSRFGAEDRRVVSAASRWDELLPGEGSVGGGGAWDGAGEVERPSVHLRAAQLCPVLPEPGGKLKVPKWRAQLGLLQPRV